MHYTDVLHSEADPVGTALGGRRTRHPLRAHLPLAGLEPWCRTSLRLEDTVAYLVRNPLSLKKLVYLDGHKAVLYRSRMNPSLGRNFEAMDPLEWLARMSDHIPDPGQHRTLFCGEYSNRARGSATRTIVRRKQGKHPSRESGAHRPGRG